MEWATRYEGNESAARSVAVAIESALELFKGGRLQSKLIIHDVGRGWVGEAQPTVQHLISSTCSVRVAGRSRPWAKGGLAGHNAEPWESDDRAKSLSWNE